MRRNDGGALATKVLDLAEQQGLLDAKAIAELRRQIAESKFLVTPEVVAKVLVDHGHLTPFQARKLVDQALGPEPEPESKGPLASGKPAGPVVPDELGFADDDLAPAGRGVPPPDDEEEIVELEAVQPAAPPPKPARPVPADRPPPAPAQPPAAGREPKAQQSKTERPRGEKPPVDKPKPEQPKSEKSKAEKSKAEKFKTQANERRPSAAVPPPPPTVAGPTVEMDPIEPAARPRRAAERPAAPTSRDGRWSAPPEEDLVPLASDSTTTATADLQPLEDLTAIDPLAAVDPLATARPTVPRKRPKNVWDSPLLLIGGGILGVTLVAFGLLLYALTIGSAAEMFEKANEEYRSGSYSNAIAVYDRFLQKYPDDPNASLARVRRNMAGLRQVSDDGRNPRLALQTAQQVLPKIETEPKFAEARIELSTILPDIADGFATQATQADSTERKVELVALAGEAMELVNNPSYLPTSLRKDRESRIASIIDKVNLAERSIRQDQELIAAVEKIAAAAERGEAAEAYAVRSQLLRTYPALEGSEQLQTAVRLVGEKEKQLVAVADEQVPAMTDDHPAAGSRVVLAVREGGAAASAAGQNVYVLVEGAVYGLDAGSGRVLWRRAVGYQATIPPLALPKDEGTDALVVDPTRSELLRLDGASGKLVWRQALDQPAGSPALSGEVIVAATRQGRLLEIDAGSGEVLRSAQLPQGVTVPAFVDRTRSRLLQLGEHSTLFVLDAATLACSETVYLGHRQGAIFVPPAAILGDVVLVVESPGDDHSLIRVLAPHEKTGRLTEVGRPFRLKGRIVTPLSVSGRRFAAMTDLGQVAVYEADPNNRKQPIRLIAGQEAGERTPITPYYTLQGNRLFLANKRSLCLEVQSSLQQLNRKWIGNQDDTFIGPLTVVDDVLVHQRRRPGGPSVLVEAAAVTDGKMLWTTHLAAPVVSLAVSDSRKAVDVLTAQGRLFSLTAEVLRSGHSDSPAFSPPLGSPPGILPDAALSRDGQKLVWTEAGDGAAYVYDVASGGPPVSCDLPAEAAAGAQLLGSRLVAPLADGSVVLLEPGRSELAAAPFLPPLSPERFPQWTRPAVLADDSGLLISDGQRAVYHVTLKQQPQPHLAAAGETPTADPVVSPLVSAGGLVFGVARSDSGDRVVGFDAQGAAALEPIPLAGRLQSGPYVVGGLVFVAAEPDGLVCLSGDGSRRWQQPLTHGPLAGSPIAAPDGDLLVIHQSGVVRRVDAAGGEELAVLDVGEPLGGAAQILGANLFLGGSDGVMHRVAVPPRP